MSNPFTLCHLDRSGAQWRDLQFPATEAKVSKRDHHYYVYIIASRTRVLYCGITNSVARRTEQHREAVFAGFTAHYQCHRLVFFEHYQYVSNALEREKQIKRWSRAKKI